VANDPQTSRRQGNRFHQLPDVFDIDTSGTANDCLRMSVVRPCIRSLQTDCRKQHKMVAGITEIGKQKYQLFSVYFYSSLNFCLCLFSVLHLPLIPSYSCLKLPSTRYFTCCCLRYFHVLSPFIFFHFPFSPTSSTPTLSYTLMLPPLPLLWSILHYSFYFALLFPFLSFALSLHLFLSSFNFLIFL